MGSFPDRRRRALTLRAELRDLADAALLEQLRPLPRDSEERAVICEILAERHTALVRSCVRRYRSSPESAEDLMQVGYVGLLKAIDNFNPEVGQSLRRMPSRASAARSSATSATSDGRYTSSDSRRNCCSRCAR